ncbi:cytochrome P450 [Microlunatus endophyticus]|uniref:Cytochrome P450 n=1 Tax=Microlunatus endophyticus TaxID=1716077 RepID=A0A917SFX4_9ACTN|nr:cytochrome P450 [Microlunatus endophyticus]GGL75946.1 cytochrome P450 [Microlunatus endophyticus]
MGLRSWFRSWLGRRLLARSGGQLDLSRLSSVPEPFRVPFLRDGLDPVPGLAERRDAEPVTRLGKLLGLNIWMVSGYPEAKQVLGDRDGYSNDIRPYVGNRDTSDAHDIGGLGFTDPPDHTRLRRILTPEFTRRRLLRLEPLIADTIERQLDELEAKGPIVDLVKDFAFPIPFTVICDLLGLPIEEREAFLELGPARFDVSSGGMGALGAGTASRTFIIEAVRRQRENPGEGLIGQIIKDNREDVTDLELAGLADGVFTGGYETSVSMLALGSLVLMRSPEAVQMLVEDPDSADQIVEELLRYLSVVQIGFPRFARRDHLLGGKQIKAGDPILVSLSGADRDPRQFGDQPDRFDPHRNPGQAHFGFGYGFHRCVGAELARMELRAVFPALARRFPEMALAVDADALEFQQLSIVYGVKSLPVRLTAELPAPV